jgi:hypothetical protein
MEWRVRLADQSPTKLAGVAVIAVAAGLAGLLFFHSIVFGVLGSAMILGSTAEFWLGSSFKIHSKGATARTGLSASEIEWGSVKRVFRQAGGVRLSPLANAGTMDAFRGVFLRYGVDNRAEIEEAIERFGGFRAGVGGGFVRVGDGSDRREDCDGNLPPGAANTGDPNARDE